MEREGADAGVGREDAGGAVALVDVAVDDEDAGDAALVEEGAGGDGDVVEDAVAGAALGPGVVRAAGHVGGEAVLQREAGGERGAAGGEEGAAGDGGGARQADAAGLLGRHRDVGDALDVGEVVDGGGTGGRDRGRGEGAAFGRKDAADGEGGAERAVLGHREGMAGAERRDVVGVEDDGKGHGVPGGVAGDPAPRGNRSQGRGRRGVTANGSAPRPAGWRC